MPKLILLLLIWFLWATGQDLNALVRFPLSTDYYIFASANLSWLFFTIGIAVFLLDTAAVYVLIRRTAGGLRIVLNALAAGAVQNIVTLAFALPHLDQVKEAYVRGRELRGLPVRPEAVEQVFATNMLVLMVILMLALYAALAFIAWRARHDFAVVAADAE